MPVTINGTTGIVNPDGSAATPSLAGADTNTGVFFPAADTVAIATGGAERVRVDSVGEVTRFNTNPGGITLKRTDGVNSNGWLNFVGSDDVVDGSVRMATDVANALTFQTAATERARIDSSGKLLVGTTGTVDLGFGTQQLTVRSTSSSAAIFDCASGVNEPAIIGITASTTGYTSNVVDLRTGMAAGTGFTFIAAAASGTTRFQVLGNGDVRNTNNSYGAISDAKLKENVVDATPKLEKLGQVRVVNFNIIGDEQKQIGVIAQELEQIFPGMVEETPDRDEEGNDLGTTTKSVKYSVFVPMLIKALQEQQAMIVALKAEVDALKGAQA